MIANVTVKKRRFFLSLRRSGMKTRGTAGIGLRKIPADGAEARKGETVFFFFFFSSGCAKSKKRAKLHMQCVLSKTNLVSKRE